MALASPNVKGRGFLTEELFCAPEKTNNRFVPTPLIEPRMEACAPFPTASIAMTAATPMTIPSTVNPERVLFELSLSSASMNTTEKFIRYLLNYLLLLHRGCE